MVHWLALFGVVQPHHMPAERQTNDQANAGSCLISIASSEGLRFEF
jgi:hypothetical protein